MSKFKVGDKVKVARKTGHGYCCWVPSMDQFLGTIQEVAYVDEQRGFYRFRGIPFSFSEGALELVLAVQTFGDLETCDYVQFDDGKWALVLKLYGKVKLLPVVNDTVYGELFAKYGVAIKGTHTIDTPILLSLDAGVRQVKRVLRPKDQADIYYTFSTAGHYDVVYEMPKVKEYTLAQLEEKLGCRIKIVKEESNNE